MNPGATKKNWLYVGMLFFILLFTIFSLPRKSSFAGKKQYLPTAEKQIVDLKKIDLKNKTSKSYFFSFLSFFLFTGLLIGFFLDLSLFRQKRFSLVNPLFPQVGWEISDLLRTGIFFCFFLCLVLFLEKIFLPHSLLNSFDSLLFFTLSNTILTEIAVFLFVFKFLVKKYSSSGKDSFSVLFWLGKIKTKKIFLGLSAYFYLLPILFFTGLLSAFLVKISGHSPTEQNFVTFLLQIKSPPLLYFSLFTAVIFGPIFEEFIFRGFLYSSLRRKFGVKKGMVFSSFLFALLHRTVYGFLAIFILGLVLAYLYEKTGSLIPAISLHIFNNTVASLFFLSLKSLL